jgi:anti-sigma B factor antagonist
VGLRRGRLLAKEIAMSSAEFLPLGELRLREAVDATGAVLVVVGSLVFGNTDTFRTAIQRLLSQPPPRLTLDLRQTSFIDSSGLGALVATRRLAQEVHVELILWGLRPQVRRIFEMVHALELFRIVDPTESNERSA